MKRVAFPVVLLLFVSTGCASNGQAVSVASKWDMASATYQTLANVGADLMERGIVKDQPTKDVIYYASQEAAKGLRESWEKIAAGEFDTANFILTRVASALDRIAQIRARHEAPPIRPTTPKRSAVLWKPSSASYSASSLISGSSNRHTTSSSPARS